VANSWLEAAVLLDLTFSLATPEKYQPDKELFAKAKKNKAFFYSTDPSEAVKDADVIYTDVWVSMGQEKEQKERKKAFSRYKRRQASEKREKGCRGNALPAGVPWTGDYR